MVVWVNAAEDPYQLECQRRGGKCKLRLAHYLAHHLAHHED